MSQTILDDDQLSGLFRSADAASVKAQCLISNQLYQS